VTDCSRLEIQIRKRSYPNEFVFVVLLSVTRPRQSGLDPGISEFGSFHQNSSFWHETITYITPGSRLGTVQPHISRLDMRYLSIDAEKNETLSKLSTLSQDVKGIFLLCAVNDEKYE
jgi:hypothetical protein